MDATDAGPRILFTPDSGPGVGGGHVMRCLALATALTGRGARCSFAVAPEGAAIVRQFATAPVQVRHAEGSGELLSIAREPRWAAVVVDSYRVNSQEEAALGASADLLVVIHDLADREHSADILIDPGFRTTAGTESARLKPGALALLGPKYALLRPEFTGEAAAGRVIPQAVGEVFVSFGLSDVAGIAARAVERLMPLQAQAAFTVAVSGEAQSLPRLREIARRDDRLQLHVDTREVAALMARADVAVGAGGSATWERCALGLPTLALVVADNQRGVIRELGAAGVLLWADIETPGFEDELSRQFQRLQARELRAELSRAARTMCDGQGAGRVSEALLARLADLA